MYDKVLYLCVYFRDIFSFLIFTFGHDIGQISILTLGYLIFSKNVFDTPLLTPNICKKYLQDHHGEHFLIT